MSGIHFVENYSFAHFCNEIATRIFIVHFAYANIGITKLKIRAEIHPDFQ